MAMDPKEKSQTIITLNNSTVSAGRDIIFGNVYNQDPTPIDHALVRQRLQKSLRTRYQHYTHLEHLFDNTKISIADSFINLALIKETEHKEKEKGLARDGLEKKYDGDGRERSREYVDERMASHEQLYAVKEPLALTELFEPKDDTPTPNKVLILGRAGIGKSILCQYLATQWASDATSFSADAKDEEVKKISVINYLQQKFDAVFWLKLREVAAKTTDRDTLLDVLDRFCLGGLKKDKPTQAELASYLEAHTDRVLFILDGYDEIIDRIEQSEYHHLNRILSDIAIQQHILLTSRPLVIDNLGDHPIQFNRRLENMGFLNEDIEAYVHKFMHTAQKPEQAVQMLNFLKLHPGVWGIAHIPINLELLSWLWSKGKLTLERGEIITLSKLYQTIIDQVQKAYIRKTSKRPIARDLDDQMESKREDRKVSTVADRVNEFLEHLAYNAMETETLFISATQIKIALEKTLIQHGHASNEYHQEQLLKSATDKLGFLRAVGQCDESQLAQDHYFIHLSFQEFYAAKYITRILSERPHAEEGDQVFQSILTEKYTPRYQLVLWMSAGLLYQQGKKSQQFSSLLRFWRAILSQPRDMIGFHHNILILHCLDECEADDRLALHKALITQQCKWFEFYGKQNWDNSYTEQFACCSILIASSSMMTYLLQVSQNGDDKLRSAAIKILGRLRNPSEAVIRVLLAASWDKDWGVRYVADLALVRINNSSEAVIEILLSGGLRDENEITRYGAAFVLGKLNSPSETVIEILLRALRNKNEYFRGVAARVLGEINGLSEAVIEDLLIALRDEDKDVKRAAASALAKINNPSEVVIKALLSALRDKDECVSHAFIKALGNLNNPSTAVIEALLSDLRDKEYARPAVVSALCNLNNPSQAVIEVLLSAFQDENVYVKRAAVEALGKLKNSNVTVIEALLRALQDKSGLVSHPAVEALGKLNNPNEAVIKALINVLQNKEWIVRNATVSALGNLNNPSQAVIEALLSALQDENDVVRYDAAGALGNLNNPSQAVIEALLSALQDESELVRYGAVEALGNLNNPSEVVIDALLSALQDEGALSSATALDNLSNANTAVIRESLSDARDENWDPKIAATEALGKLNNPSKAIIKALLSALQDKNLNVRDAAVQALSTPKTIQATILIFKQLIKDEQRSFKYFSCWFKENYLLLIDHKKGKIVARRGRQNYTISLSPNDLLRLEKQILFIADQQNYLPEFYNLPGRNSNHTEQAILQRCEPDASICFVSDAMWLVHLVRKKISQRTLLIVEGITVEKDIMQCYEFTLSLRSSNPRSGFFLPGSGIGCVLKTKNFLNLLEKDKKDYQCKTWDIDPATGQRLLRLLEAEASSSKMQRNDCFTWAEEKLTAIGLPVEGHWTDFNVILPAVVAEKAKIAEPYNVRRNSEAEQPILVTVRENSKAEKSIRVAEESRGCRLM